MSIVTLALAYYAYRTIEEGRKQRKKDTIEKMLENVFFPLYETLRRARFEEGRRGIRQEKFHRGPRDYAFQERELAGMREIIERYGHYLDPVRLMKFNMDLDKYDLVIPSYDTRKAPSRYYRFWNGDMDPYFEYFKRRCEELREQLQRLTVGF